MSDLELFLAFQVSYRTAKVTPRNSGPVRTWFGFSMRTNRITRSSGHDFRLPQSTGDGFLKFHIPRGKMCVLSLLHGTRCLHDYWTQRTSKIKTNGQTIETKALFIAAAVEIKSGGRIMCPRMLSRISGEQYLKWLKIVQHTYFVSPPEQRPRVSYRC